jgi:hypothetical protein
MTAERIILCSSNDPIWRHGADPKRARRRRKPPSPECPFSPFPAKALNALSGATLRTRLLSWSKNTRCMQKCGAVVPQV